MMNTSYTNSQKVEPDQVFPDLSNALLVN